MSEFQDHSLSTSNSRSVSTQLMVGAASPLWGFFAGAAASGVAFWWATRWAQPTNLEALWGRGLAERAAEPQTAVALKALEPLIAAGEAVEAASAELVPDAGPDPTAFEPDRVLEALAPEPVVEVAPGAPAVNIEPIVETDLTAAPTEAPKPRRKVTPSIAEPPVD